MAKARTVHSLFFAVVLLSPLTLSAVGVVGDGSRSQCPRIPSMTAERACSAVSGPRPMLGLCLRTLGAGGAGTAVPVTVHAAAAVSAALDAYAATVAAATSLIDGGTVPADDEKAAYERCMLWYDVARGAMARVADDLAAGGCGTAAAELKAGYTDALRGMDGCWRGLLNYPASPLYARYLADRNNTMLAAMLCNLVPAPPA